MALNDNVWPRVLEKLYGLRRDKRGTHERPHKPLLLLAIIDLLDRGEIESNAVPLSDDLVSTFKRFFDVVRGENDRPTIQYPFVHLRGDGFWDLLPRRGQPALSREAASLGGLGVEQLRRRVSHGAFSPEYWTLLSDPVTRERLREATIARYFPNSAAALLEASGQPHEVVPPNASPLNELPGRDAAFRATILDIYDYTCAACGVRLLVNHQTPLVEAAHLIPFRIAQNDHPTNGVALCLNHRWAMDNNLIAPCPDDDHPAGRWQVNERRLDDRIEGQRPLTELRGVRVSAPRVAKYAPAAESLQWREKRLATG